MRSSSRQSRLRAVQRRRTPRRRRSRSCTVASFATSMEQLVVCFSCAALVASMLEGVAFSHSSASLSSCSQPVSTNCTTLTEKELSQHCADVSCEHRNSTPPAPPPPSLLPLSSPPRLPSPHPTENWATNTNESGSVRHECELQRCGDVLSGPWLEMRGCP